MTEPLRYPLTEDGDGWRYGPWHLHPYDGIALHPSSDWQFYHEDYDGAPDANDTCAGTAADRDGCIAAIHEWEDDND